MTEHILHDHSLFPAKSSPLSILSEVSTPSLSLILTVVFLFMVVHLSFNNGMVWVPPSCLVQWKSRYAAVSALGCFHASGSFVITVG